MVFKKVKHFFHFFEKNEKENAAANLQPHVQTGQLLLGFLGDNHGVNLRDLLIFSGNLDLELVFAFLQSQIFGQFHGSLRVEGVGGDFDFFNVLVSIGIQLILGFVLVETLDGRAVLDPQGYQIGIVTEMIAAEAVVILSFQRIHVGLHVDFAAAGTLQPMEACVGSPAEGVVVGVMVGGQPLFLLGDQPCLVLCCQVVKRLIGHFNGGAVKFCTDVGPVAGGIVGVGFDFLVIKPAVSGNGHGNHRNDQNQSQQQGNAFFHSKNPPL